VIDRIRDAVEGHDLGADAMRAAIGELMDGQASPAQVAALLVALALKGETPAEIAGAAMAMRSHAIPVRSSRHPIVDVC